MPLEKNFGHAVAVTEEHKREFTKLTELDENDKNTIYNLIFTATEVETNHEK